MCWMEGAKWRGQRAVRVVLVSIVLDAWFQLSPSPCSLRMAKEKCGYGGTGKLVVPDGVELIAVGILAMAAASSSIRPLNN